MREPSWGLPPADYQLSRVVQASAHETQLKQHPAQVCTPGRLQQLPCTQPCSQAAGDRGAPVVQVGCQVLCQEPAHLDNSNEHKMSGLST